MVTLSQDPRFKNIVISDQPGRRPQLCSAFRTLDNRDAMSTGVVSCKEMLSMRYAALSATKN
jgi:hypothetical protein